MCSLYINAVSIPSAMLVLTIDSLAILIVPRCGSGFFLDGVPRGGERSSIVMSTHIVRPSAAPPTPAIAMAYAAVISRPATRW